MQASVILNGQVLSFDSEPHPEAPEEAARIDEAIALDGGRIVKIGTKADLTATYPRARIEDKGAKIIMAGFVDAHAHYPQTAMIASWGKRLIDWLNTYTFPEETRFSNRAYADDVAARYLDLTASYGTTTVCTYCTIHPESVDAIFAEAQARGQRLVAGKTCMDRNTAPNTLRDTAQSAYDDSQSLIASWHGVDRLSYAITPRFSPTSTPEQLSALGALWREHPDCLMQTHLSEQTDEIEWVRQLYPGARDYLYP
ncbi:MAG: amidohydrolase family protein, partial [Arenibacterium sp.]